MDYSLSVTTTRAHQGENDLPVRRQAAVHLEGATAEAPVTLADVKALLAYVSNQNVPDSAVVGTAFDMALSW